MKIPISELNKKDVDITPYLDDCLILSSSFELSFQNTKTAIDQFQKLGFFVHGHPKSSFIPAHVIEFLGFELNSINMTICLTKSKKEKFKNLCLHILQLSSVKIRQIASLIGKITSAFPASKFGKLHYRGLENLKTYALKTNRFNFEAKITLNDRAIEDINWWVENIDFDFDVLWRPNPSLVMCKVMLPFLAGEHT